jgi:hypothetical protein
MTFTRPALFFQRSTGWTVMKHFDEPGSSAAAADGAVGRKARSLHRQGPESTAR